MTSAFAAWALLLLLRSLALAFFAWLDRRVALAPQQRAGDFWSGWRLGLLVWVIDRRWTIVIWITSALCLLTISVIVVRDREVRRQDQELEQEAIRDREEQALRDQPEIVISHPPSRSPKPSATQPGTPGGAR